MAKGLQVTAVEPSLAMAAVLRQRFPDVAIQTSGFEECVAEPASFAVVTAAQAWHWVDPTVGPNKAADALRPGGWLALMWNRPDLDGCTWHDEIQPIYERVTPNNTHAKNTTTAFEIERAVVQLGRSGRFGPCVTRGSVGGALHHQRVHRLDGHVLRPSHPARRAARRTARLDRHVARRARRRSSTIRS